MAVDIKDVEQVAQDLQQKFDDFKAKNDKRIDAIEQEKSKLAEQVESLNGQISELENLKSDLEAELAEVKRPAGGTKNKVAGEHKDAFTWPAVQNDRTGSRLYLLRRSKLTNKTPQLARDYAREALAWMVEDGVASRLDINAVRTGTDSLALAITIYQRDGNIHNIIFDDIWSELNG